MAPLSGVIFSTNIQTDKRADWQNLIARLDSSLMVKSGSAAQFSQYQRW